MAHGSREVWAVLQVLPSKIFTQVSAGAHASVGDWKCCPLLERKLLEIVLCHYVCGFFYLFPSISNAINNHQLELHHGSFDSSFDHVITVLALDPRLQISANKH